MTVNVHSFPPIVPDDAKVLILGTLPGRRSLEQNQYYAHPGNVFWKLMGPICHAGPELPYAQRVMRLKEAGIALWDVLQHAERTGSLDSSIVDSSVIPNDFGRFLGIRPTIKAVFFNGNKAEKLFRRKVAPTIQLMLSSVQSYIVLPSTSPANTRTSVREKQTQWDEIRRFL